MASNGKDELIPLYSSIGSRPSFRSSPMALFVTLSPAEIGMEIAGLANAGDADALAWLSKFVSVSKPRKGTVNTLYDFSPLEEAVDRAADVEVRKSPFITKKRRIEYVHSYPSHFEGDPYAAALLRIIEAGLLRRIRYCALKDCGKLFFAADPRSRWCTASCGNRHRQRMLYRRQTLEKGKKK